MKKRAIIIDDDKSIQMLFSAFLEGQGYEVIKCSEPSSCIMCTNESCQCEENFVCADIIITDLNMPEMNGLDFIERQRKKGCKVNKFAAMSGGWSEEETNRAREMNCEIIRKPFNIMSVASWIEECQKTIDPKRRLIDSPIIK